jgi:hypothetical protein
MNVSRVHDGGRTNRGASIVTEHIDKLRRFGEGSN